MRYCNGVTVLIPWLDTNNNRNHSRFAFKGNVDRRRVRRQIRKAMSAAQMRAPKWWLNHYIKHRSYVSDPTT